jgi:hypothetical protein
MPTPAPAETIFIKVSCLVVLLTASPEPRAVLNNSTFTPMSLGDAAGKRQAQKLRTLTEDRNSVLLYESWALCSCLAED